MKVSTSDEMRTLDKMTIELTGIPGIVLMENASRAVFERCKEYIGDQKDKRVVVVCGVGNNGGDGFAVARMLKNYGVDTRILLTGSPQMIQGDALINFEIAQNMEIIDFDENSFDSYDLIVDAIFGTGFHGETPEDIALIIDMINGSGKHIISVDMPSGVNATTGHVAKSCINACETVTFGLPKIGNILYPGAEHSGKLRIANISIPKQNVEALNIKANILTKNEANEMLPKRKIRSNKGTYGKVMVFAGSEEMLGAGVLSCKGAYKSGCGLVYANMPKACSTVMHTLVPEAVFNTVEDYNGMFCERSLENVNGLNESKAIIIGPGIGQGEEVSNFVERIFSKAKRAMIIDADALNIISKKKELLNILSGKDVVITPHPGEMSRLIGLSAKEILANPIEVALNFAMDYGITVLLKDSRTIIASSTGEVFINTTGNNSMAKGGSGDVLSGIIGGFIAQGLNSFDSAVLGAYVHGMAGDLAAEGLSNYGVMAGDLANFIPYAIKEIQK